MIFFRPDGVSCPSAGAVAQRATPRTSRIATSPPIPNVDPIAKNGPTLVYSPIPGVWYRDSLQSDDQSRGHQHLAGTQPDALQLLVLHHQFFAVSDGDLPVVLSAEVVLYVLHPHSDRGECTGPDDGDATFKRVVPAGVCNRCHGRESDCIAKSLSVVITQLPQCEQLTWTHLPHDLCWLGFNFFDCRMFLRRWPMC